MREVSQPGVSIRFRHEHVPRKIDERISTFVYRVVQEALQNALKHSGASTISIDLRGDDGTLHLSVVDDGKGFDVELLRGNGLGLISMEERLNNAEGTLTISSAPNQGTRIRASLPLAPKGADTPPRSALLPDSRRDAEPA